MKLNIDIESYKEFIKDERELEFVLGLTEETILVDQKMTALQLHLEHKKNAGEVFNYFIRENRIEVDASRYTIYLLVLHNGDVCQYTLNKRSETRANYSRRMYFRATLDTLDKFIG